MTIARIDARDAALAWSTLAICVDDTRHMMASRSQNLYDALICMTADIVEKLTCADGSCHLRQQFKYEIHK